MTAWLFVALSLTQDPHAHAGPPPPAASLSVLELTKRSTPIRSGIGSAHDEVSTASKEAQAFYDQGLAHLHSYVWLEDRKSVV